MISYNIFSYLYSYFSENGSLGWDVPTMKQLCTTCVTYKKNGTMESFHRRRDTLQTRTACGSITGYSFNFFTLEHCGGYTKLYTFNCIGWHFIQNHIKWTVIRICISWIVESSTCKSSYLDSLGWNAFSRHISDTGTPISSSIICKLMAFINCWLISESGCP